MFLIRNRGLVTDAKNKKIIICVIAVCCAAAIAAVAIILSVVLKKPSEDAPKYYDADVRLKLGETVTDNSGNSLRVDSVELTKSVNFDGSVYTSEKGGFIVFYGEAKFIDVYGSELITEESLTYQCLQEYVYIIGKINEKDSFWTDE